MMNNMLMQMIMSFMSGNANPNMLLNMLQNPQNMQQIQTNPMMARAKEMTNGKSPQEIEQICKNIAAQKGLDYNQVKQMAQQFGIKFD